MDITFMELLQYALYILITVILPVVVKYIVNLIKIKINESNALLEITKSEQIANKIKDAISEIMDAVECINQTYTDALKAKGEFTKEAQTEAFNKTKVIALQMIADETKEIIAEFYGDFDEWLKVKIEALVKQAKKE